MSSILSELEHIGRRVDEIAAGGGGGGGGLPAVTAEDNGDVLTVVNGAWDKAAPSGGGSGVMVVKATLQSYEDIIYQGAVSVDGDYADLSAKVLAGDVVFINMAVCTTDGEIDPEGELSNYMLFLPNIEGGRVFWRYPDPYRELDDVELSYLEENNSWLLIGQF